MTHESSSAKRAAKHNLPLNHQDASEPSVTEPAIDWEQSTASSGSDPSGPRAPVPQFGLPSSDSQGASEEHSLSLDIADVVREHHVAVYRYALRLSGSPADAEDLCQQTFLTAHRKLHQLREPSRVRGWLYRILRNCFFKSRRKLRPVDAASLELDVQAVPEEPASGEEIDQERLQAALNELPDPFRVVVLMFYFEQSSYKEIAAELDVPMGTVMSRLNRAKEHLRANLGG